MKIDVLTLFPNIIKETLRDSIIKRAIDNNLVEINVHDYREYSFNKNKKVDDYSYGGGAGMIIGMQPIVSCLDNIKKSCNCKIVLTSPTGKVYNQEKAKELSILEQIIIICGHYEGIDNRIENYIDEAISIGDFILTGGEIAALVIVDSIVRLIPNVLGNSESVEIESFDNNLLEYPQYTRPEIFNNYVVPEVLLSGNHEKIRKWRRFKSLELTYKNRPDLLEKSILSNEDEKFLTLIKEGKKFDEI